MVVVAALVAAPVPGADLPARLGIVVVAVGLFAAAHPEEKEKHDA
jgi:hypothetical protein